MLDYFIGGAVLLGVGVAAGYLIATCIDRLVTMLARRQ